MKKPSSQQWLREHFADPFVKEAQKQGYPSRSAFKLLQIQQKEKLLRPGMSVVDLGAAPGGWSMVAKELVGDKGQVVALDLLPLTVSLNVDFIQGDFTDETVLQQLLSVIPKSGGVDWVFSDMAPNMSGVKGIDQPRSLYLAECACDLAQQVLKPGGGLLLKVFHGSGVEELVKQLRQQYKSVKWCKPQASRSRSAEIYLLAREFLGPA